MEQPKKSFDWISFFRIVFLGTLPFWFLLMLFGLGMSSDYNSNKPFANRAVDWLLYPVVGLASMFIGWILQKKNKQKIATIITSIPSVIVSILILFFIIVFTYTLFSTYFPFNGKARYSGQIVISFKDGTTNQEAEDVLNKNGLELPFFYSSDRKHLKTAGFYIVKVEKGKESEVARILLNDSHINTAEYGFNYSKLYE
ncbi:MAG: hypothetical protein UU16_C0040G0013 [Candidatus Woesebacteria bacterium GW2011_GWA2_40_7]|uniref:Uncharacterized protein n=2 Tax=Candidatus Woeseibacteriota TaxID=1752722 RepID=A0A0G0PQG9_9BACT|nr:MAG: hypothetical protein UT17_C0005G0024 [Candidatus Woesebacteria bacterium GW2011_GWB1_39_10]KKR72425.1 MAG: hypothetical protein UU16_C0040G0013 [Candidatus Woesebacteria bacterium GW2011_GWA2_40_7]